MPRFIAFLRAINVGGHVVKMERLRALFEELALSSVETFIASGNVIFESRANARALEQKIESHLRASLGYEVATFVRSVAELAEIAAYQAFPPTRLKEANALHIAFLQARPSLEAQQKLMSFRSAVDDFHVHEREVYWSCLTRGSESPFFKVGIERAIRMPATMRSVTTVRKLAARFPSR